MCGLALLVISADVPKPRAPLTQAETALQSADYQQAIQIYVEVEDSVTDPGIVAYNKALALYQLALEQAERKQEKELLRDSLAHFRYCQNDPLPERRARALLGQGNCLLRLNPKYRAVVQQAIDSFRRVLSSTTNKELLEQAKHNVELARLLWLDAQERPPRDPDEDPKNNGTDNSNQDDEPDKKDGDNQGDKPKTSVGQKDRKKVVKDKAADKQGPQKSDDPPPAGQGNKPLAVQDLPLANLSEGNAQEQLSEAAQRIRLERRKYRFQAAKQAMQAVKDW